MKDYHINIFYSDEDGGYIADIPDLKTCSAFGATAEEARYAGSPTCSVSTFLAADKNLKCIGRRAIIWPTPFCLIV